MDAGFNEVLYLDNSHARLSCPRVGKAVNILAVMKISSQIIVDPPQSRVKRFIVTLLPKLVKGF
jgi:hypothetical protein